LSRSGFLVVRQNHLLPEHLEKIIDTYQFRKAEIDLAAVNQELRSLEQEIIAATENHNEFLQELGLPPLP
jgi:type I restriction enzyme M protein